MFLNYHHLKYFWEVAREGSVRAAATRLRVSQSAVSTQIRELEAQLGTPLFERVGRGLVLSEAGRIAQTAADAIFSTGEELVATLGRAGRAAAQPLQVGATATLSRNFQESFLRPAISRVETQLVLRSGGVDALLEELARHELDVVLTNRPVRATRDRPFRCQLIARQPVSIVSRPQRRRLRWGRELVQLPLLVPGADNELRAGFEALCARLGVTPTIRAQVDDMALLRLLARDAGVPALLPTVVVRDELSTGLLQEFCVVPGLFERFYAVTVARRYPHPLVEELLSQTQREVLKSIPPGRAPT